MKTPTLIVFLLLAATAFGTSGAPTLQSHPAEDRRYVAFSLREAHRHLVAGTAIPPELPTIGGITHLAGFIHDRTSDDLILVGSHRPGFPEASLEDLVVAVRSICGTGEAPLVSLDPNEDTARTGLVVATYKGGIRGTRMGDQMLSADIYLKRLATGDAEARLWGIQSYGDLAVREASRTNGGGSKRTSQFWFKCRKPTIANDDDVYALIDIGLGVETELTGGRDEDPVGREFCRRVEQAIDDMAGHVPLMHQARQFVAMVSIAEGIRRSVPIPKLSYWLNRYRVTNIVARETFQVITSRYPLAEGGPHLTVSGGLDLKPSVARLRRGHTDEFKRLVLGSRPSSSSLHWSPPIHGWEIPGAGTIEVANEAAPDSGQAPGFTLESNWGGQSGGIQTPPTPFTAFPKPAFPSPSIHVEPVPLNPKFAGIGGVALTATAHMQGVSDDNRGFSFLSEPGGGGRIDPDELQRFVTSLWAVYYSDTDPGISIDPIAPGVKQHLVRYIGRVINSDLAATMRIADYTMKSWAVGTERPRVPGYRSPDDIAGRRGVAYVGAGSRFWFVPADLTFRQAEGILVFESGRMTLQTEYLFQGNQGQKADPANEEWARWFTDNMKTLSNEAPVLEKLFQYARLVAIAKYLRDSGTPLLWYLMAQKHRALTETAGTVAELVKDSEHFDGLRITGGVQLVAPANYVLDEAALGALRSAASIAPRAPDSSARPDTSPGRGTEAVRPRKEHTVIPQSSLRCGRDERGNRYQTDIGLRTDGRPALELVRWSDGTSTKPGEFGMGWHLLVPYTIHPDGDQMTNFGTVQIPAKMRIRNVLSGKNESLAFSPELLLDRSAGTNGTRVAGWGPASVADSEVVALFLMNNGTFALKDKLNCLYRFDPAGAMTALGFGPGKEYRIRYADEDLELLNPDSLAIEVGEERVRSGERNVPRALTFVDEATQTRITYLLADDSGGATYESADPAEGPGSIELLSDQTFRLTSAGGNRIAFDEQGRMQSARLNGDRRMVKQIEFGEHIVEFRYALNPSGHAFVHTARVRLQGTDSAVREVQYRYDRHGHLQFAGTPPELAASTSPKTGK